MREKRGDEEEALGEEAKGREKEEGGQREREERGGSL